MIRPKLIDHIVLRTDHYRELIDFYCDVLGCTLERETSDEVGLTQLRAGDSLIDIVNVDGELGKVGGPSPSEEGNNVDHFCLQIEPVGEEALKAYLRENGGSGRRVSRSVWRSRVRTFHLSEGHRR